MKSKLLLRLAAQTTVWLAVMAVILFSAAGDWRWPRGWVFLAETAVSSLAVCIWLAKHDPALLEQRLTSPVHRNQQPWDRVFMSLMIIGFVGWLVLLPLDARRFHWSSMPLWGQGLGILAIASCMVLVWLVFRFNTFAVPQARIQAERGQHVIDDGPYRLVRHPMYAGAVLFFLGTTLLLGSVWGLLAVPFFAAAMGVRAIGEERMLRKDLAGYEDYIRQVQYRLVPGVW